MAEIDTNNALQKIEMRHLHPLTLVQRFVLSLPALALVLIPALRTSDAESRFSLVAALLYGIVALPFILLHYLRFTYGITPREIVIKSGVLTRRHRNIPIERIQNVEIERRLLPRLMGTAKVKIETAGSTTTEGVLEYVSLREAQRIREAVRSHQRKDGALVAPMAASAEAPGATEADPLEPPAADVLFSMPPGRVLLSGMFRFSLLYIALAFSAIEYLGLGPQDVVEWIARDRYHRLAGASPWLLAVATVAMVALLAWLTGIAINVNKYYRFKLWVEGDKLRKRAGLLTVAEGTIPLRRVQALIVRTNPLMRAMGWYGLEFQTIGLQAQQRGNQAAAPFGHLDEVMAVARALRPVSMPATFERVSHLAIRRTFVRYAVVLLVVALPASYLWPAATWVLLGLPLVLYYAVLAYRNHGYTLAGDALYVRRGVLRHHVWIIPIERFQVFHTSATLFQRRLGLRSVYVDTAGAPALHYPAIHDLPADVAEALSDRLYEAFEKEMGAA